MTECTKTAFASEREARTAMNYLRKSHIARHMRKNRVPCRVYRCEVCDQYHMTSQKR